MIQKYKAVTICGKSGIGLDERRHIKPKIDGDSIDFRLAKSYDAIDAATVPAPVADKV